jgi:hypothetical protein
MENRTKKGARDLTASKGKLEDDIDALYGLPLSEFTAARNALAGRLKQERRGHEADFVKTLAKPSVSAWAANQLYWKHREVFDRLIAASDRLRQAQTSSRKMTDLRGALDARHEALSQLSDLATALMRDAGHNPNLDAVRRVTATLEAMSVYASIPDGPRPGRLAHDVDPPGFESLSSLIPVTGTTERIKEPARVTPSKESARVATSTQRKAEAAAESRRVEETRQARVAAAKDSLREAKGLLSEARARAVSLEAAQKKAQAEAKTADKHKREAEERYEKARAASEAAARHAQTIAAEVKQSARALEEAKHTVEKASKELEKAFRESPAR